jgi:hypothetical protein
MADFKLICSATEHALANFYGSDDFDQDIIELVAMRIDEHVSKMEDNPVLNGYFDDVLASTSTFVQADMDEEELNSYVAELVDQLEEYGVV